MTPLDVREWLEAERLAGNEWAVELMDLLDGEDEAREHADAIQDLRKLAPEALKPKPGQIVEYGETWRLVEFLTDRIHELDEIREVADEFGANVASPNGMPPTDTADKLRMMFESGHWLLYDL